MQLGFSGIGLALVMLGWQSSAPLKPNAVVIDSHRLPPAEVARSEFSVVSTDHKSYSVRLMISKTREQMFISATSGSSRLGNVALNLSNYPGIEVSPFIGAYHHEMEIIFKFGKQRPGCFANDDGRDRIKVWFSSKRQPLVSTESFANDCR